MPTVAVVSLGRHSRRRHSGERHRFSLGLFLFLGRCGCALDPLLSGRRRQSTRIGLDNGGHRAAALNIQVVYLLQKKYTRTLATRADRAMRITCTLPPFV